jgi:hypothetical protein
MRATVTRYTQLMELSAKWQAAKVAKDWSAAKVAKGSLDEAVAAAVDSVVARYENLKLKAKWGAVNAAQAELSDKWQTAKAAKDWPAAKAAKAALDAAIAATTDLPQARDDKFAFEDWKVARRRVLEEGTYERIRLEASNPLPAIKYLAGAYNREANRQGEADDYDAAEAYSQAATHAKEEWEKACPLPSSSDERTWGVLKTVDKKYK